MTVPASKAPAVKAWLVTNITTAIADPAVLVCYDEPGPNQPDDIVSVGDIRRKLDRLADVGSFQARAFYEDYSIVVTISCYRGGDNAQLVFERAAALVQIIETLCRNDPTLGGNTGEAWPDQQEWKSSWEQDHKGRVAEFTVEVHCWNES